MCLHRGPECRCFTVSSSAHYGGVGVCRRSGSGGRCRVSLVCNDKHLNNWGKRPQSRYKARHRPAPAGNTLISLGKRGASSRADHRDSPGVPLAPPRRDSWCLPPARSRLDLHTHGAPRKDSSTMLEFQPHGDFAPFKDIPPIRNTRCVQISGREHEPCSHRITITVLRAVLF